MFSVRCGARFSTMLRRHTSARAPPRPFARICRATEARRFFPDLRRAERNWLLPPRKGPRNSPMAATGHHRVRRFEDRQCRVRILGHRQAGHAGSRPREALACHAYQFRRRESWVTRAALPELRTLRSPSELTVVGLFGLFSALKKSTLNRVVTRSVMLMNLNAEASRNH